MQTKRLQNIFSWFVVLSELSHVFCCVLPSIFTILAILTTMGLMTYMPDWLYHIHDAMHVWEVPIIITSGIILFMSWGLHFFSKKIDCHSTGCVHGPCEPMKDKNATVLKIATLLFVANIALYAFFHVTRHPDHIGDHPETGAVIEQHTHDH